MLEACEDESMLIQTVKSIVDESNQNEDEYFLVTEVQDGHTAQMEVVDEETMSVVNEPHKNSTWSEMCRICANVNDHLIPIFEGEGAEHGLCSKIHKHLPIHVSETDSLPLQLCYHCAATLLAWHELAEGCVDAEHRLLQIQTELQQKQQYFHATSLNGMDQVTVTTAGDVTNDSNRAELLLQHRQQVQVKGEASEESVTNDSERFKNHDSFTHLSSFIDFQKAYRALLHSNKNPAKHRASSISRNVKTHQPCDSSLGKVPAYKMSESSNYDVGNARKALHSLEKPTLQDLLSNDEKENTGVSSEGGCNTKCFVCPICAKAFGRQTLLDEHVTAVHMESCLQPMREESSTEDSDLPEPAISQSLTTNPFDCKLCGKKFRLQESFRTHMRIHTGEKPFTCHICGKQFGQTGSLYYHLKHVHGGVKNHSCDICGRSFAMKAAMEDHRRIHTGERPYVCASCGKTFKTKASLYIHSKTHTDEYPYKCTYCTKAFRWRQQMLGHLTIHTGEKNHMCDICGKGFGVKNDLTRHKRIHSEEKPYVCQQCGIGFGQKRYLKSHERARHR